MKKLTFTIGTQSRYFKSFFYKVQTLKDLISKDLDYATFTECQGCYKYEDGTVCSEPSLKVEVILFDDDYKKQVEICNHITFVARLCSQESYLYEIQTSNSYSATFIYC